MTVIVWEPTEGKESGHAVFGHASRHPWKLPIASFEIFLQLQREFEHQTECNKSVIYWDMVNVMRQHAQERTGGKRHDG